MSLSSLPAELLYQIKSYVASIPTLRALASVSRRFYDIADPLLYQHDAKCVRSAAITWAAEHGRIDIMEKALSHGVAIPVKAFSSGIYIHEGRQTVYGYDQYRFEDCYPHPLCLAVQSGHLDVMESLISRGCDINMRYPQNLSLLCHAVIHGHIHLVKALLDLGAYQDNTSKHSHNSLYRLQHSREIGRLSKYY